MERTYESSSALTFYVDADTTPGNREPMFWMFRNSKRRDLHNIILKNGCNGIIAPNESIGEQLDILQSKKTRNGGCVRDMQESKHNDDGVR